jgi:hypothetical protein
MAVEKALIAKSNSDTSLTPAQRDALIRKVEAQLDNGEFPEEAIGVTTRSVFLFASSVREDR